MVEAAGIKRSRSPVQNTKKGDTDYPVLPFFSL